MARARNIKPGTMENEALAALSPLHRLLWIFLWMLADRAGRFEDRPGRIKAKALPYDRADVDAMLTDLHEAGFIVRYAVDGQRYVQVVHFDRHQNPHRNERPSVIPPVPDADALPTTVESTSDQGVNDLPPCDEALSTFDGSARADSLILRFSDSLILRFTDSLILRVALQKRHLGFQSLSRAKNAIRAAHGCPMRGRCLMNGPPGPCVSADSRPMR